MSFDKHKSYFSYRDGKIIADYDAIYEAVNDVAEEVKRNSFANYISELDLVLLNAAKHLHSGVKIKLSEYAEENINLLIKHLLKEKIHFRFFKTEFYRGMQTFSTLESGGFEFISKVNHLNFINCLSYDEIKRVAESNLLDVKANVRRYILQLFVVINNE
jgi:hypothetical protein